MSAVARVLASSYVNLGIARRGEQRYEVVAASSFHPLPVSCWEAAHQFPPDALDPYWRHPAYVSTLAEIAARHCAPECFASFLAAGAVTDILGLVAMVDDWSLAIGAPQPSAVELESHQRQLLTQLAERGVLDLVRLGWTNKRIAEARGRSERTIANQVAALLRKVEVPSRRGLATR